ncbi:hypothetical protein ACLOJK_028672, partial [Asimina triloba]
LLSARCSDGRKMILLPSISAIAACIAAARKLGFLGPLPDLPVLADLRCCRSDLKATKAMMKLLLELMEVMPMRWVAVKSNLGLTYRRRLAGWLGSSEQCVAGGGSHRQLGVDHGPLYKRFGRSVVVAMSPVFLFEQIVQSAVADKLIRRQPWPPSLLMMVKHRNRCSGGALTFGVPALYKL